MTEQSRNKHHGFRGRRANGETGGSWHEGLLGDNGQLVLPTPKGRDAGSLGVPNPDFAAPEPVKIKAGMGHPDGFSASVKELGVEDGDTFVVRRAEIRLGGFADKRAQVRTAARLFADDGYAETGHGRVPDDLSGYVGEKVSLAMLSQDGSVTNFEGTVAGIRDGKLELISKGARTSGYRLDLGRLIAIEKGYGRSDEINRLLAVTAQRVPPVAEVRNFNDLPDTYEPGLPIHSAYLIDRPWFDGQTLSGAMFLATDVQRQEGDDIVNGYLWCPPGTPGAHRLGIAEGFSEHGSMYGSELKQWGGRITSYPPGAMTFQEAHDLPDDADAAYRLVGTWEE